MASEHSPNGKTQQQLFHMRSGARTADIQRRSQMNETTELARIQAEEDQGRRKKKRQEELLENGEKWLANSEDTITRLVKQSAAFSRAIVHMAEAWGPAGQDPIEAANTIIQKMVTDIEQDAQFNHDAKTWSQARIKDGAPPAKAQVKKRQKPKH